MGRSIWRLAEPGLWSDQVVVFKPLNVIDRLWTGNHLQQKHGLGVWAVYFMRTLRTFPQIYVKFVSINIKIALIQPKEKVKGVFTWVCRTNTLKEDRSTRLKIYCLGSPSELTKKGTLLEALTYTKRQQSFLLDVDQGGRGWGKRNM